MYFQVTGLLSSEMDQNGIGATNEFSIFCLQQRQGEFWILLFEPFGNFGLETHILYSNGFVENLCGQHNLLQLVVLLWCVDLHKVYKMI